MGTVGIVSFSLWGLAASGLDMLWYFCDLYVGQGEAPAYGTKENARVEVFEGKKTTAHQMACTLHLAYPGIYTYRFRARDKLYPIVWQPHQSEVGTLIVHVLPMEGQPPNDR